MKTPSPAYPLGMLKLDYNPGLSPEFLLTLRARTAETGITNIDPENRPLMEEFLAGYGNPLLVLDSNPLPGSHGARGPSLHNLGERGDLGAFWAGYKKFTETREQETRAHLHNLEHLPLGITPPPVGFAYRAEEPLPLPLNHNHHRDCAVLRPDGNWKIGATGKSRLHYALRCGSPLEQLNRKQNNTKTFNDQAGIIAFLKQELLQQTAETRRLRQELTRRKSHS